jgi:hypothetical protein
MSALKHGHRSTRTIARVLAGAGLLLLAAPSPPVFASNYHDLLCRVPYGPFAGRAAPTDDVTYATSGGYVFAGNGCASGGALFAAMDGEVPHTVGSGGWDTFSAPGGLSITAFTVWRYEADGPVQPFGAPASNLAYIPGPASVEGLCAQSLGCNSRGTPSNPFDPSNAVRVGGLSGVTQIQWSASCGGGPGGECPASGSGTLSSQYNVYAADIDLVDSTPPSVSNLSGPLIAGGTLTGPQAVSFDASDGQSGVYSGSLVVDGHTAVSQILNTNGGACESLGITTDGQRSFEHAQPCLPSVSASLTLNTNQFAAGQHSLELVVDDAAGNQTIAYNGTITTSGPPLVGVNGGSITGPHIPNGIPCAGEALDLTVNGKRRPPVVLYGKKVTVSGVLHCGTVPIRNARIIIATLGGPPSAAINTTVQSALDGSFSYKVPRGPDRVLNFSYTAYSNDPGPSASATVAVMVRPRIRLRIRPHRTSNGHTIHWSGTIAGGPYPQQGISLDVEVREGKHWRTIEQIVAHKKGRFHYSYRFHATTVTSTYVFRVALPHTGSRDYAYTPGASNTVKVYVRP